MKKYTKYTVRGHYRDLGDRRIRVCKHVRRRAKKLDPVIQDGRDLILEDLKRIWQRRRKA